MSLFSYNGLGSLLQKKQWEGRLCCHSQNLLTDAPRALSSRNGELPKQLFKKTLNDSWNKVKRRGSKGTPPHPFKYCTTNNPEWGLQSTIICSPQEIQVLKVKLFYYIISCFFHDATQSGIQWGPQDLPREPHSLSLSPHICNMKIITLTDLTAWLKGWQDICEALWSSFIFVIVI